MFDSPPADWRQRFLNRDLEQQLQRYREQTFVRSCGTNMIVALVTVVLAHLAIAIFAFEHLRAVTIAAVCLVYPPQIATILLTPRATTAAEIWRLEWLVVAADLGAVLMIIAVGQLRMGSTVFALGCLVILIFDLGIVNRRPMAHIVGVLAVIAIGFQAVLGVQHAKGLLDGGTLWSASIITWLAGMQSLVLARDGERLMRQAFLQEKTIASQRENIERLLKQEVSYQVAERSRAMSESLANVDVALPSAHLEPGRRFDARYVVTRELGRGGMGAVYEVERLTDHRRLALKVITGNVTGTQAARFAREAEIGARLEHENLVQIVDIGISPGGAPYLVMELVEGSSLDERREKFGQPDWALPVLRQIARGLSALHEAGVVHRDLKPANVLLSGDPSAPRARISDFGISRFGVLVSENVDPLGKTADPSSGLKGQSLTMTGAIIGTPLYMAPEAARGGHAVDKPADVFAFGLVAYELLTNRRPFEAPAALEAMAGRALARPAPFESPLAPTVLACLAEGPGARPSIREVLEAFR